MSEKRGAEELDDEVYEKLDEKTKDYLKDHADMVRVAKKICNDHGLASIKDISLCAKIINLETYDKIITEKDEIIIEQKKEMMKYSVMRYGDLKDGDINLQLDGGTETLSLNPEHDDATCIIKSDTFTKLKASNMISTLGEGVAIGITSVLFASKNGDGTESGKLVFKYSNERMVRNIVEKFLDDAVKTCNRLIHKVGGEQGLDNLPRVAIIIECSMFKQEPDHLVVYDERSYAPLVTVEVDKPLKERGLQKYPKLCGQGFDYLMATKMTGNVCPMHITTTVDESYVAWLPENDKNVKTFNVNLETDLNAVLSEIIDKARRESGGDQLTQSPRKGDTCAHDSIFERLVDREIYSSEIFHSHDLFFTMVNTILCAMSSSSLGDCVPPLLNIDGRVSQTALKLNEEYYEWVEIDGMIKKGGIHELPSPSIYALGIVGFGATSKAFRVVTKDGHEGVLKMYLKTTDDFENEVSKAQYMKIAQASVTKELTIFENTYPKMPVFKVKCADRHGLMMPHFEPLDPIGISSLVTTEMITKVLEGIKYGTSSYAYYKDEDVRWRHFGKYDGQIVAFDFNDMDELTLDDAKREEKILEQCEDLFKRIPMKPPA